MSYLISTQISKHQNKNLSIQTRQILHQIMLEKSITHIKNVNEIRYFRAFEGKNPSLYQFIETQWKFIIDQLNINVNIAFSSTRTLGRLLKIQDQRFKVETNLLLKKINVSTKFDFIYQITKQGLIVLYAQRSVSNCSKNIDINLRTFIQSIQLDINYNFPLIIPYLIIANGFRQQQIYQKQYKYQQLTNKQKITDLKDCFDNYRNNRNNSTKAIYNRQNSQLIIQKLSQIFTFITPKLSFFIKNTLCKTQQLQKNQSIQLEYAKNWLEIKTYSQQDFQKTFQSRILTGIVIIQKIQDKLTIQTGAHSSLKIIKYQFQLVKSINKQCQSSSEQQQQQIVTRLYKSYLIQKVPLQKQSSKKSFRKQIDCLTSIRSSRCPFIGKYFLQPNYKNMLFMPVYKENLSQLIFNNKNQKIILSIQYKLNLFKQIAQGICFLSSRNICHRDLKPANIMITNAMIPKIIDFGSCVPVFGETDFKVQDKRLLGTQGYYYRYQKCPQQIQKLYTRQQYQQHLYFDSYSLGRIIQRLFFQGNTIFSQKHAIIQENLKYVMSRCLDQNPDDRMSSNEVAAFFQLLIKILHQINFVMSF